LYKRRTGKPTVDSYSILTFEAECRLARLREHLLPEAFEDAANENKGMHRVLFPRQGAYDEPGSVMSKWLSKVLLDAEQGEYDNLEDSDKSESDKKEEFWSDDYHEEEKWERLIDKFEDPKTKSGKTTKKPNGHSKARGDWSGEARHRQRGRKHLRMMMTVGRPRLSLCPWVADGLQEGLLWEEIIRGALNGHLGPSWWRDLQGPRVPGRPAGG
jgi:hypothetical protein